MAITVVVHIVAELAGLRKGRLIEVVAVSLALVEAVLVDVSVGIILSCMGITGVVLDAGPLKQRDINGLEMHVRVAGHLWKELGGWEEPLAYLQAMVERGETGLDSGKGYYDWSGKDPVEVRSDKDEQLLQRTRQVMEAWEARQGQS